MEAACNDQIGACYFWLMQYEKALDYYKMAYEIHVELGNRNWLGHTCYNLAELYIQFGDRKQARPYFDEGVALAKELRDERMLRLFEQLLPQTELNERLRKALHYVKQHDEIANRTYREGNCKAGTERLEGSGGEGRVQEGGRWSFVAL